MELFNLDCNKTQLKQAEVEKLAEIQTKFLIPAMEKKDDADLVIKIRDGSIVHCEKRGIKLEKITFAKLEIDN